jgi:hypothetical protein
MQVIFMRRTFWGGYREDRIQVRIGAAQARTE